LTRASTSPPQRQDRLCLLLPRSVALPPPPHERSNADVVLSSWLDILNQPSLPRRVATVEADFARCRSFTRYSAIRCRPPLVAFAARMMFSRRSDIVVHCRPRSVAVGRLEEEESEAVEGRFLLAT
ncbi:hypothetical protein Dimus_022148, partial [Dionaea muscipula]